MSREERLARMLLANERGSVSFEVELHDDGERDLVATYMVKWGCHVEVDPNRPRLRVTITDECLSTASQ